MEHVSAVTLHFILNVLESKYKLDTKELLTKLSIDSTLFLEENGYIESDKLKTLFMYAARMCQDPCLALNLGAAASAQSLGLLGYMLANSENVYDMLRRLCRFSILIGKNLQFTISEENASIKLEFHRADNPLIPLPQHQVEIHLSAVMTLIRQLSNREIMPILGQFQYERVEHKEAYGALFGKYLHFNAYENALFFSAQSLQSPLKNAYPGLLKYFETQAQKIIENFYDASWNSRLRKLILIRIGSDAIDLNTLAKLLNSNVRTLQNHLKREGVSYTKLLEDIRKKMAHYYLQNFSIDIGTIAIYLGYNDLSSFTRSFTLWYGLSPQHYRAHLPFNSGHGALLP